MGPNAFRPHLQPTGESPAELMGTIVMERMHYACINPIQSIDPQFPAHSSCPSQWNR